MKFILEFISTFIIASTIIYIWHKFFDEKINIKSIKLYIITIILTTISFITYEYINDYLRMIVLVSSMIICCKLLFNNSMRNTILNVVYTELIIIVSEFIYVILASLMVKYNLQTLVSFCEITLITDVAVSFLSILLQKVPIVHKLYKGLRKITSNIKNYQLFLFLLLLISTLSYICFVTYYSNNIIFTAILNFLISLVYLIIIIMILHNKNKYNVIAEKYNNSINDLLSYEKLIENYRVTMHEDKNTLKTIQGMTNNKKIVSFISNVLNEKYEYINNISDKLINIPSGGLKGLLYAKISTIEENNINYSLIIDKSIKYKDFDYINDELMIKICKVIGVLLDNAIEESLIIQNPEIKIQIVKINKNISFIIGNIYNTKIDISKIGTKPISSKGNGHGFGLMLVNKIVNTESRLENKTTLSRDYFTQELIIKN